MLPVYDIIAQAQQSDLDTETQRIKDDREKRRILRLQAQQSGESSGISMSELLKQISDENLDDDILKLESEEAANEPQIKSENAFPPPPTGPTSNTST